MKILFGLVVLAAASGVAQENPAAPEVALSVSGMGDGLTAKGWPLTIAVTIVSDDGRRVSAGLVDKTWPAAVKLEIRNSDGELLDWPLRLISALPETLSIVGQDSAIAVYALAPEFTAVLAEGRYSVRASLDTTTGAESWSWVGLVQSGLAPLNLIAEPDPLTKDQEATKYLLLADYEEGNGNVEGALQQLDLLLEKQPDQLAAVTARADLFMTAERWADALAEYQRAIRIARRLRPDPSHPPAELMRRQTLAATKLAAQEKP